jgi:hypothetical protein
VEVREGQQQGFDRLSEILFNDLLMLPERDRTRIVRLAAEFGGSPSPWRLRERYADSR